LYLCALFMPEPPDQSPPNFAQASPPTQEGLCDLMYTTISQDSPRAANFHNLLTNLELKLDHSFVLYYWVLTQMGSALLTIKKQI